MILRLHEHITYRFQLHHAHMTNDEAIVASVAYHAYLPTMPKIRKPFGSKDTETYRIRSKGPKILKIRKPLDPKDTKTFWIDLVGAIFLARQDFARRRRRPLLHKDVDDGQSNQYFSRYSTNPSVRTKLKVLREWRQQACHRRRRRRRCGVWRRPWPTYGRIIFGKRRHYNED